MNFMHETLTCDFMSIVSNGRLSRMFMSQTDILKAEKDYVRQGSMQGIDEYRKGHHEH